MKKKVYRVYYFMDGKGYVDVEAESKEEAQDKFYDWDVIGEPVEGGENFDFDRAEGQEDLPF